MMEYWGVLSHASEPQLLWVQKTIVLTLFPGLQCLTFFSATPSSPSGPPCSLSLGRVINNKISCSGLNTQHSVSALWPVRSPCSLQTESSWAKLSSTNVWVKCKSLEGSLTLSSKTTEVESAVACGCPSCGLLMGFIVTAWIHSLRMCLIQQKYLCNPYKSQFPVY